MQPHEVIHKMAFDAIGMAAQILTPQTDALMALVEAERNMHTTLAFTDPTTYRDALHSKGLQQQVQLARAALQFISAVQDVKNQITGDKADG